MAFLATLLAGRPLHAAASASEKRDWEFACKLFEQARISMTWFLAERSFEQFKDKYPASEYYADAVVFEAQARFNQDNYDGVISLLSAETNHMGAAADQFAYWTARAYAKKRNFEAAADTFARLARENPNSSLRLQAIFGEADAHAKLQQWPQVIEELAAPGGVFQQIARTNLSDDLVVNGLLLLGGAQLEQKDYGAVKKTLSPLAAEKLRPELEWDRLSLLCRAQLAGGQTDIALQTGTNLLAAAAGNAQLRARSLALQGQIFVAMGDLPAAIQVYETGLASDLPDDRQAALLRITELELRQNKIADAAKQLSDYLAAHPGEKGADFEELLLGELHLREYFLPITNGAATNLLALAETAFQKLAATNGEYRGKAELNLGWCYWTERKFPESHAAFSNAVERLPFSEDQAVARFKLGDILYQQNDYAGALENYDLLLSKYGSLPSVKNDLFEPALYQMVRASLDETNQASATAALGRILEWFPNGLLSESSMLLVGQAESPADARKLFADLKQRFPDSPLLPEIRLAVARTYEREMNWNDAINQYNLWIDAYSNNPALPQAEFARAWANYQAGNTSNAFLLFTNFIARYQSNAVARGSDLPARAQYWVGDYYWKQEPPEYQKAEISYEEVFTKWTNSPLAFQAQMMAGRAAMGRLDPHAAIDYFNKLSLNSNCPPELAAQALFASGDAWQKADASKAGEGEAIRIFRYIINTYTNNPISAMAWGRLGDCYFALAASDPSQYAIVTNAFTQVMESSLADASLRSMAEFRLGQALEAMARLKPPAEQKAAFTAALGHFLRVVYGGNLKDNEPADVYYVKLAALEAASLCEELGEWSQAIQYYQTLEKIAPPLQALLEKKIARAQLAAR